MTDQNTSPLTPLKNGVHHQVSRFGRWIPIFIGMIGFSGANAEPPIIDQIPPLETGMTKKMAIATMKDYGWRYVPPKIIIHDSTLLWMMEPCRAAEIESTETYERQTLERPPRNLMVKLRFYKCENEDAKSLGLLSEFEVMEDKNAKNK